jgi:hypothetical protein
MYKLICQKPAHFLSAQMEVLSSFLEMFIPVLGMNNFGKVGKKQSKEHTFIKVHCTIKATWFSNLGA